MAAQSMLFQDPIVSRAFPDKVFSGTTLTLCFKEPDIPDETYGIPNTNEEPNPLKDSSALAVQRPKLFLNGGVMMQSESLVETEYRKLGLLLYPAHEKNARQNISWRFLVGPKILCVRSLYGERVARQTWRLLFKKCAVKQKD